MSVFVGIGAAIFLFIAGITSGIRAANRRGPIDPRLIISRPRPWCETCGTSHRNPIVTVECERVTAEAES